MSARDAGVDDNVYALVLGMVSLPVRDPLAGARFYNEMCGATILVATTTHALLSFGGVGTKLYLERRDFPVPAEVTMQVATVGQFQRTHALWLATRRACVSPPAHWSGVGQCFVGLDPDGNRCRVLVAIGWEHGCGPAGTLDPAPPLRQ